MWYSDFNETPHTERVGEKKLLNSFREKDAANNHADKDRCRWRAAVSYENMRFHFMLLNLSSISASLNRTLTTEFFSGPGLYFT